MVIKCKCPKCGKNFDAENNLISDGNFANDFLKNTKELEASAIEESFKVRISELEKNIDELKNEPSIIAKIIKVYKNDKVVIVLPNKNKFYVDKKKDLKLKVFDEVICQNSNLKVMSKLN